MTDVAEKHTDGRWIAETAEEASTYALVGIDYVTRADVEAEASARQAASQAPQTAGPSADVWAQARAEVEAEAAEWDRTRKADADRDARLLPHKRALINASRSVEDGRAAGRSWADLVPEVDAVTEALARLHVAEKAEGLEADAARSLAGLAPSLRLDDLSSSGADVTAPERARIERANAHARRLRQIVGAAT